MRRFTMFAGMCCVLVTAVSLADEKPRNASDANAAKLPASLVSEIEARISRNAPPGIVIGLLEDGKVTWFCRGVAQVDNSTAATAGLVPDDAPVGVPVTPDTVFEIGSISKCFTALLLADEVTSGRAALNDPVAKHLPAGTVIPEKDGVEITLEHLATHRSGLPRMPSNFSSLSWLNPYASYDQAKMFDSLTSAELSHTPGEHYEYSNMAVGLLGIALETMGGRTYGQLVEDRIVGPLGMESTTVPGPRAAASSSLSANGADDEAEECSSPEKPSSRLAVGHRWGVPTAYWDKFDAFAGAGAIRSSGRDMIRFVQAHLQPESTPLAPAIKKALAVRHHTDRPSIGIALGWHVLEREADGDIYWHNGGTGGFRAFCGFQLSTGRGVVVLSNSTTSVDDIGFRLLDNKKSFSTTESAAEHSDGDGSADGETGPCE